MGGNYEKTWPKLLQIYDLNWNRMEKFFQAWNNNIGENFFVTRFIWKIFQYVVKMGKPHLKYIVREPF